MVGEVEVKHWKRFGHNRLYVTIDGVTIGSSCLLTGAEDLPDDPDRLRIFREQVAGWRSANPGLIPEQRPGAADSVPTPKQQVTPQVGVDLAAHVAGAAAQARAEELAAARVSVLAELEHRAQQLADRLRQQAAEQESDFRRRHPIRAFFRKVFRRSTLEDQVQGAVNEIMAARPPVSAEERAFRIGAQGEHATGLELGLLPPPWRVLHAVPVGERGSDIDHVVIGPAGVFTLNSKHHRGKSVWVGGDAFKVNGTWTRNVEKSRFEAQRATALLGAAGIALPTPVRAAIVVIGATSITVKAPPDGVAVLGLDALIGWLTNQPTTLTDAQVEAIYQRARNSAVWVTR